MRISDWSSDVCSSDLKTGQFSAGEAGWRIENISSDKIMPNYFFDQSELAWYTACWMAILKMSMDQVASLRSEEHTSELQSLMRISYAVFCLKKKTHTQQKKPQTR